MVTGRVRWDRPLRQPLLPRKRLAAGAAWRRARQPREALGDLQWRAGGVQGATRMARLAAPYGRRAAASRPAALSVGKTAPAQYDRHTFCLLSARLDPARRPPRPRHRRLRALDPRVGRLFGS